MSKPTTIADLTLASQLAASIEAHYRQPVPQYRLIWRSQVIEFAREGTPHTDAALQAAIRRVDSLTWALAVVSVEAVDDLPSPTFASTPKVSGYIGHLIETKTPVVGYSRLYTDGQLSQYLGLDTGDNWEGRIVRVCQMYPYTH